jgi:hypothetical protein
MSREDTQLLSHPPALYITHNTLHTPHSAAPPSPYLPPPPSNPRVFPREGFSSLGGDRSAHPPNSKPYVISPTGLSDSPPAELDACSPPPRAQDTPPEPSQWAVPSPQPAAQPRCWDRPDASLGVGTGVPPQCCRRGGRGLPDPTASPLILTLFPSTRPTNPITRHTRTHVYWPPPPGGQALLDHGISQPHLIS